MIKVKEISNKMVWITTVFLLSAITIFESYTWGKYILVLACTIILVLDIWSGKGKYYLKFSQYHYFIIGLIMYTLLSSIWGINAGDCLTKTYTYIQILICMTIVYNHYRQFEDERQLLSIIKWSSYIISIYSIIYYGFDFILKMITTGVRIDNTYTNINTIGMLAAMGIVIQVDEMKRKHKVLVSSIFCVPSFIMVVATQSRKALLMLVVGVLLVFILRSVKKGKLFFNILKIIGIVIIGILLIKYLASFPIFSGINERMEYLVAMFTGRGIIGQSAQIRQKMIELGIEIFKSHPLVGIGIGCPHIIAGQVLNYDAYLHNNFVEMLAAGGIIGFLFYYFFSYGYLAVKFFKLKREKDNYWVICCVLWVLLLFRDYALVSMYSKETYFYFMIFFLTIEKMNERKEII